MFGTAYGYVPDPSNEVGSYVPNDGGTQDSAMLYYFSNETLPGTGGILSNQADISGSSSAMRSATYTTVSCNPKSAVAGSSTVITCWADPDRLSGSVQPTGTVRWSQAGTGSVSFKSTACTLMHGSDAVCFVVVVGAVNGHVIITATYMGDSSDKGSSGTAKLTITKASTHTTLSCAKSSFGVGTKITCTAAVSGGYPSHTGTVTWSKVSGTGKVTFSSKTCTLSSGKCSVTITATAAGSVKIEATYGGDSHNLRSSGTFVLTMA